MHDTGLSDGIKSLSHGSKDKGVCFVQVPAKWNIHISFSEFIRPQTRTTDATFTVSEWGTGLKGLETEKHQKWGEKKKPPKTN